MQSNFDRSLKAVLAHEGGWADHPKDPGGATMKGVTLATYRRYKPGATKAELRKITNAELKQIYRDGYWTKIRGDELPSGADYAVFDFAVNSGPGRAIPFLQRVVGVTADGKFGPATMEAVRKMAPDTIVKMLCTRRLAWLQTLSTWGTFGKGWSSRVNGVKKLGLQMAAAPVIIPAKPSPPPPDIEPPETAPAPAPEPGFFMRFWRWLIGR